MQDAAVSGDAFNVGTVMSVLRPMTRLTEITDEKTGKGTGKFKVVVDFPDTDPNTGEPTVTLAHARERCEADEGLAASLRQPLQVRRGQRHRVEFGNRRPRVGQRRQD